MRQDEVGDAPAPAGGLKGLLEEIPGVAIAGEKHRVGEGKTEHFDEACYLTTVPFGREERLVLVQVLGVEVARPPVGRRGRPTSRAVWNASLSR